MSDELNGLDAKINIRGYFERILSERDQRDAERDKRISESFASSEKAVSAALAAAEKAVVAALAATEKAVQKAEEGQRRVNEGQNEFRQALKDQTALAMPRQEAELIFREQRTQIEGLRQARDSQAGRQAGVNLSAGILVGAVAVLSTFVGLIVVVANALTN